MTETLKIAFFAEGFESLAQDVESILRFDGFRFSYLGADDRVSRNSSSLIRFDMFAVFYPEHGKVAMPMGIARGLDKPVVVLISQNTDRRALPRGVKLASSTGQMVAQLRRAAVTLGRREHKVTPDILEQYGACSPGVDWFREQLPQGGPVKAWTPEIQKKLLIEGGAKWMRGAILYGLVDFHPMSHEDFSGQDLSEARLQGTRFDHAKFRGGKLAEANFGFATLDHADFSGADLTNAAFRNASILTADFTGAILSSAHLERATGRDAVFDQIDGTQANFSDADLSHASFRDADLTLTFFRDSTLKGADFRGAKLDRTYFLGADLEGADFGGADVGQIVIDPDQERYLHAG